MADPIKGPTLDCYGGVGLTFEFNYASLNFSGKHGISIFGDRVKAVRPNDLGGISITFSPLVEYRGPSEGPLRLFDHGMPLDLDPKYVGRIKNGKDVIWQNPGIA